MGLLGRRNNTRTVRVSAATWAEVEGQAPEDAPVFRSPGGGFLCASQIGRSVKAGPRRAPIAGDVSLHWLRHCHASHALEKGARLATVKETLGHADLAVTSRYVHVKPGNSPGLYLAL